MPPTAGAALIALLLGNLANPASAQATNTSANHVLLQSQQGDGNTARSASFVLHSAFSHGTIPVPTASASFRLEGGFPASLATTTPNRPWLTAVRPLTTSLNAPGSLVLHGTNLHLGTSPTLRIGSTPVTVTSRQRDRISATIPGLTIPGWHPVTLSTSAGQTTIARGLAVLPLIETRPAAASSVPFELVFRGTQGDQLLWAMGIAAGPLTVLPGIRYGFGLLPPTFIIYSGFTIRGVDGELRLPFPATSYPTGAVFLQGLFIGNGSAYGPAAFSNVLRI